MKSLFPAFLALAYGIMVTGASPRAAILQVTVHVFASDGKPKAGVTIRLNGQTGSVLGTTDSRGVARISAKRGATVVAIDQHRLSASARITAESLTIRFLPVIAVVTARGPLNPTVRNMSPAAIVAGSLRNALRLNPQFRSAAEGGSDAEEVNGIPLALPLGAGTSMANSFTSELFDSVTPQSADGSSIPDFHLVNPTSDPLVGASFSTRSYDDTFWKATSSGRRGRFGYGASLADEHDEGILAGRRSLDLSGFTYDHSSNEKQLGGTLNALYNLGPTSLSFSAVASQRSALDISTVKPGPIAQGYGPNANVSSSNTTGWITLGQSMGRDQLLLVDVRYDGSGYTDHRNAYFEGLPAPYTLGFGYTGSYQLLKVTRSFHNAAVSFQAVAQAFDLHNAGYDALNALSSSNSVASYQLNFQRSEARFSYGGNIGVTRSNGPLPLSSPELHAHASYTSGAFTASAETAIEQSQNNESDGVAAQTLVPPQSAVFNCTSGTAAVFGPSITNGKHPTKTLVETNLRYGTETENVSAGGFITREHNAIVEDQASLPIGLPPGYEPQLQQYFGSNCPGQAFTAQDVFAQRYVQVPVLDTNEFYVSGKTHIGAFSISGFYESLSRYTTAPIPGLTFTTLVPYTQLPFIPRDRANLLVSLNAHGTLLAADALYTSVNNADALPAHVELMIGAAKTVGKGTLSLSLDNPFGAYGGRYVSPQYAVALAASSGSFLPLATPLARTWSIEYTFSRPLAHNK